MGILSDRQIRNEIGITPFKDYGPKEPGTISSGLGSYGYDVRLGYKFRVFTPIGVKEIDPKNFDPKALVDIDLTPVEHDWIGMKIPKLLSVPETDSGYDKCSYCGKEEHKDEHGYEQGRDNTCRKSQPDHLLIPPHSFVLAESLEKFKIPRSVLCVVVGKSTYARCGLIVNVTPGEPEWEGVWTIEISNTTPLPVRVYPGEGIMQTMFFRSDEEASQLDMELRHLIAVLNPINSGEIMLKDYLARRRKATCQRSYADKSGKYMHQTGLTLPKAEGGAANG